MSALDHPAVREPAARPRESGPDRSADGVHVLDDEVRTAASAALGVPVGVIAHNLVFKARHGTEDRLLPAPTSGAHRADAARQGALTADTISRTAPDLVHRHTGQATPAGHPAPLRTLVDRHKVMWAAAIHPESASSTDYADLVVLTGGTDANVATEEDDPIP